MNLLKSDVLMAMGLAFFLAAAFIFLSAGSAESALPNFHSRVLSMSTTTVGPDATVTVSTAKESCATRVVTTGGTGIMLGFDTDFDLSNTQGHIQGSSSTVAYDAELYGCGAMTAHASASTTITISEFVF